MTSQNKIKVLQVFDLHGSKNVTPGVLVDVLCSPGVVKAVDDNQTLYHPLKLIKACRGGEISSFDNMGTYSEI